MASISLTQLRRNVQAAYGNSKEVGSSTISKPVGIVILVKGQSMSNERNEKRCAPGTTRGHPQHDPDGHQVPAVLQENPSSRDAPSRV